MPIILILLISSISLIGLTLLFAVLWRRVVPTNMVHIVQSSKKTMSYGKGREVGNTYYEIPSFIPMFGVSVTQFPESIFDVSLRDYEAYDIGRLPFIVDIKAFFRIENSDIAAQRVANFSELQQQLGGVLQGAVRGILGNERLELIMQERASLGEKFTQEVNEQLAEWGVRTAKMIEFMDIRDSHNSKVIINMMDKEKSRIEMESRVQVANNMREAEMKEIEAQREVSLSRTEAEQQIGIRSAEAEKEVGLAKERSDQQVQTEARTTAEKIMEVRRVQQVKESEIQREVAVVKAEESKQTQILNSQAQKETGILQAEETKAVDILVAEGKLSATEKESTGVALLGEAKAKAETAILMAPVTAQLELAKEIGDNEGYQKYLVQVRQLEATEVVGREMAQSLASADLKIIANGGDIGTGISTIGGMFSPQGGLNLGAMLDSIAQTEVGKALTDKITAPAPEGKIKK